MKKWFKKQWDEYKEFRYYDGQYLWDCERGMQDEYTPKYPKLYHRIRWLRYAYGLMFNYSLALRCRIKGHDMVDDSHCDPDSGDMDMYCKRCGFSFHHQLY